MHEDPSALSIPSKTSASDLLTVAIHTTHLNVNLFTLFGQPGMTRGKSSSPS